MLHANKSAGLVELGFFTFRPLVERADIDDNLSFSVETYLRAVHRSRSRAFEVDALAVVPTAMARAFEFVFTGLPVRRAAEMRAARVDDKETIGSSRHPDAILLLPLGIDAKRVVGGSPNTKDAGRFKNRARQEEPHEHQEERRECTGDGGPHDATAHLVHRRIGACFHRGSRSRRFSRRGRRVVLPHLHSGRTIDRLDYPSPDLRRINSELPGVANFRGYTSTLLTERYLYNFTYRDSSLRSKTNY